MQMSPIINLINLLNDMLKPLGDAEYQKRVWVERKGPGVFDYEEATMVFMQHCEELLELPKGHEGVNDFVYQKLKNFYDKLCYFDDVVTYKLPEDDDEAIISSPEWEEIRNLANETYHSVINNLKERNYEIE